MKRGRRKSEAIPNIVCVSDLHAGCQLALFPPGLGLKLDGGGQYEPSELQQKLWSMWCEFWDTWVPTVTKGEPFVLVVNGDCLDGVHHGSVTQITHNLETQRRIAEAILAPVVRRAAAYYHMRGTEAHVGPSGQDEEAVARALGAIPDESGNHARWDLWYDLRGHLGHFTHHIGTTGSMAYETTALMKEFSEALAESARQGKEPPRFIVRSHRHRSLKIDVPMSGDSPDGLAIITPGWQLKTPFSFRIAGGRQSQPQIGGVLIRAGDRLLYSERRLWHMERPRVERARV